MKQKYNINLSEFAEKYCMNINETPKYLLYQAKCIDANILEKAVNPFKPHSQYRIFQYLNARFGKTHATMIVCSSEKQAMEHSNKLLPAKLIRSMDSE